MSERNIPVERVDPNPFQTRTSFNEEKMAELAESIKAIGLLNKILVRPHPGDPERFQLVHGERRLRAYKKLEWKTIPAIIRNLSDENLVEINLIENLQREDLNPIDEAQGLKLALKKLGMTQTELGERIGKSQEYVANSLRLLKLPNWIQFCILHKIFSPWHGRILGSVKNKWHQKYLFNLILEWKLSVNELRKCVNQLKEKSYFSIIRDISLHKIKTDFYDRVYKNTDRHTSVPEKRGLLNVPIIVIYSSYQLAFNGVKLKDLEKLGLEKVETELIFLHIREGDPNWVTNRNIKLIQFYFWLQSLPEDECSMLSLPNRTTRAKGWLHELEEEIFITQTMIDRRE